MILSRQKRRNQLLVALGKTLWNSFGQSFATNCRVTNDGLATVRAEVLRRRRRYLGTASLLARSTQRGGGEGQ